MKQFRITILLTVLMSMFGAKAFAYDIEVENAEGVTIYYNYTNDGKELEVTKGIGEYKGDIVIPEEVTFMSRPRKVTRIGDYAFERCTSLTSVTIPNSVISIGHGVFKYCPSLTSVTIPNSVTSIGDIVFDSCTNLTSVSLPNSLTSIGGGTFQYCSRLTSVSIPGSVTSIGNGAFNGCSSLTSITIPNSVTSIGEFAFSGCTSLTSIIIPNSVTSIGDLAFEDCTNLTSVTIPNSVTSIGKKAFYGYDLPIVVSLIEDPFPIDGNTFSKNTFNNATLYVPAGTIDKYKDTKGWKDFLFIEEVPEPDPVLIDGIYYILNDWAKTAKVTYERRDSYDNYLSYYSGDIHIPESVSYNGVTYSVTSIGEYAFFNGVYVTSVDIPNSVTLIDNYAFVECRAMPSVTIPNGVTSIGNSAFRRCFSLTSFIIPDNVTFIGFDAFDGCSFTDIYCYAKVVPSAHGAFMIDDYDRTILHVDDSLIEQYKATYDWACFKTIVGLSETGITEISNDTQEGLIYNLNGNRLKDMSKGINLIRQKDGRVIKVLKK